MVHTRLNQRESNPNPHINFITALPIPSSDDQEDAKQLLRALAAQVRPVMKAHGFVVNSLEEYEHNKVFAGRNWNNGETVELVLRGSTGLFLQTSWLMSTFCHELAHIKHMNHGPAFQALWKRLRTEVRDLQNRGYYGDGYWSSGTRLADSSKVMGVGVEAGDFPEFMCGGAQSRTRPTAIRRRHPNKTRKTDGPSNHTGRQTAKKRKAGARVTSSDAFVGQGLALNTDRGKGKGTGFGKQAGSKRAREERALAAERRIRALQVQTQAPPPLNPAPTDPHTGSTTDDGSSSENEIEIRETDQDRRRTLFGSESNIEDLKSMEGASSWGEFESEFDFGKGNDSSSAHASGSRTIGISSDDEAEGASCDSPTASGSSSTFTTATSSNNRSRPAEHDRKGKRADTPGQDSQDIIEVTDHRPTTIQRNSTKPTAQSSVNTLGKSTTGVGRLVQSEIELRKKESLGMAPTRAGGRKLGGVGGTRAFGRLGEGSSTDVPNRAPQPHSSPVHIEAGSEIGTGAAPDITESDITKISTGKGPRRGWTCLVCTLCNEVNHLACSACATPRGERVWAR